MLTAFKRWWSGLWAARAEREAELRAAQTAASIERSRAAHGLGAERPKRKRPRVVRRDTVSSDPPKQADVSFLFADDRGRR
jgi:hypothetical protein